MAAAMWRARGGTAESAGLYALCGSHASYGAVEAMKARGIDLTEHRAHPLSEEIMLRADAIVAMTQAHALALAEQFPRFKDKIRVMPIEISDPFGGDEDDYLRCAGEIDRALDLMKNEQ